MQILFITHSLPYPPDKSSRMRTWQVLKYLYQRNHQVIFVSFVSPQEEGYVQFLWQVCSGVYTVPIENWFLRHSTAYLRWLISRRPFLVERDAHKEMRTTVNAILDSGQVDFIHIQHLSMAQYVFPHLDLKIGARTAVSEDRERKQPAYHLPGLILDVNQAEWFIAERMRWDVPKFLRPFFALEAKRIKRYEGIMLELADHVICSTDKTVEKLQEASAYAAEQGNKDGNISLQRQNIPFTVIQNGLDLSEFPLSARLPGSKMILSIGSFNNPAFLDGIGWFLQDALPQILQVIPEARFVVVGKNPPIDLLNLVGQGSGAVAFARDVSQLAEYLNACALTVFPLRSGRGFRKYVLEALAFGIPVISTSVGLEGIEAIPGQDVLLADTPIKFTEEVIRLLLDESLQGHLARAGRELAESRYEWQAVLADLDGIYWMNEGTTHA
jgi:polysaccharide biosynthesis protein PslH